MFRLLTLLIAIGVGLSSSLAGESSRSQDGSLAVEVVDTLSIKDGRGTKEMAVKIYYPRTGGPYPLIVFSHGFGGDKEAFGPVGKHWASHGYVVIHPSHGDGLGRTRGEPQSESEDAEKPRGRGRGGLLGGLNDPNKISARVADLVLILDSLEQLPNLVPGLKNKIDPNAIGVAGHSFGAYTAMLIGGVTADLGQEKGKSFLDKRVKCILPISAQGTGQQGLTDSSWDGLRLPMMTITGTRDRGVGGQGVDWKKEPYKYSPAGDKYLVVIEGANHLSFGGGLRARGDGVTDVVKRCTTSYWDAYLKDSKVAKEHLKSGRLEQELAGKCTLEQK
jgi:predicted dienelactone hydrolase